MMQLIDHLLSSPQQYEFFQAILSLEKTISLENIRYRSLVTIDIPCYEIHHIKQNDELYEIYTQFLQFLGYKGILPNHYTDLVLQRLQLKDEAMKDFLDIFNHSILLLYYKSWKKYHCHHTYVSNKANEPLTNILSSFIGSYLQPLQEQLTISNEMLCYYAGLLSRSIRSANVLKNILADYFDIPVAIRECQGQWLKLDDGNLTQLTHQHNQYAQLGKTSIAGKKVWNIQHNFRLLLGPFDFNEFKQWLPGCKKLLSLIEFVHYYLGISYCFDIQLILKAEEVPYCQLSNYPPSSYLGWTTWLKTKPFSQPAQNTILNLSN